MNSLGVLTAFGLLLVYSALVRGLALAVLWSWFVASKFNLPVLSVPDAVGLMTIVLFLFGGRRDKKDSETYEQLLWVCLGHVTLQALMALGIGFIVKLFL